MGKKKVKPSAFGEFMAEHIKKEKRSGRTYPKVIDLLLHTQIFVAKSETKAHCCNISCVFLLVSCRLNGHKLLNHIGA